MSSKGLWARARAGVSFVIALMAVACEQATDADSPPVSRIEVDPAQASVAAARTVTLTARVYGATGEDLGAMPVFWSTQNPQVATVNQAGVVTGVGPGTTQIAASLNGRSGIAAVTVTARPVVVVRVSPSESDVSTGKTLQLAVEALDGDGAAIVGRVATWSSANPTIATVNGAGLVSGLAAGTATVRATIDGVQGTALVRVVPIAVTQMRVSPTSASIPQGDFTQLTATPLDAQGNALTGRLIVWSSSNQSVAVVSSTGHVQSVSVGSATITATSEGVSATAAVTVTPVPVASVTIVPANPSVVLGQTATLSATVRDGQGNVLNGRSVTWSSSTPAVASISASGVLTGVSLGSTTITALSGGVSGTTTATVSAVPVASVSVSPSSASVFVGGTFQFLATAEDAQGNVLTGRTVLWSTSAPNVATVNAVGLVTGVSAGSAAVTATVGGLTAAASITVSVVPVASVTVAPNPASVEEKLTLQLTPTLKDASGNVLTGRSLTWSSDNVAVATVSPTGLITGVAPGSATVTVNVSGTSVSTSVPVTVTAAPVASVGVQPSTASVQVGATTTFSATLLDAGGQPLSTSGRTLTWSSSDPSKATVNSSTGVATGVAAAQAVTITATASSQGQSPPVTGTATLMVIGGPNTVAVAITPDSLILPASGGGTLPGVVTVTDAASTPLSGQTVTLSSSSTSVATVAPTSGTTDASGQVTFTVTGVAAGNATITATSGGKSGTKTVRMLRPVSSVTLSPGNVTQNINVPVTFTITATASNGSNLQGRPCTFASSNTAVATVSPASGTGITNNQGRITFTATGIAKGTATITATCEGVSRTSTMTVQ